MSLTIPLITLDLLNAAGPTATVTVVNTHSTSNGTLLQAFMSGTATSGEQSFAKNGTFTLQLNSNTLLTSSAPLVIRATAVASGDPVASPVNVNYNPLTASVNSINYLFDNAGTLLYTSASPSGDLDLVAVGVAYQPASGDAAFAAIGPSAFQGNTTITQVEIPDAVTRIGANAFQGCSSLTNVFLGPYSGLTSIGATAFNSCTSLGITQIPSSVTTIGSGAFTNCTGGLIVYFLSTPFGTSGTPVGPGVFDNGMGVIFGATPVTLYYPDFDGTNFPSEIDQNGVASAPDVYVTDATGTILYGAVTALGGALDLASLSAVTTIMPQAFQNTGITSLTLPSSLVTIYKYAFDGCSTLSGATVTLPAALGLSGNLLQAGAFTNISNVTFVFQQATNPFGSDANPGVFSAGQSLTFQSDNFSASIDGYTLTTGGGGGGGGVGGGDPYITTISNIHYKLPTMDAPIRFYQGLVDGELLTVNVTLKTTPNDALAVANLRSFLELQGAMTQKQRSRMGAAVFKDETLCFFETVYIKHGANSLTVNLWDSKFKILDYKGKIASALVDGSKLLEQGTTHYKNYKGQTLKLSLGSANVFLSVYNAPIIRNGIGVFAPHMKTGNGVCVNALSASAMKLDSLQSLAPVSKVDSVTKVVKKEAFMDKDGYRERKVISYC